MQDQVYYGISADLSEKHFESDMESAFINENKFRKIDKNLYNKDSMIFDDIFIEFIKSSQPKAYKRYENYYASETNTKLIRRLYDSITTRGILDVLKHGFKDMGIQIYVCYAKPISNLNDDLITLYNKNIFGITRQFSYSKNNSNTIDTILSLNGIPLFAVELKNQFKNQSYIDAITQWKENRDPKEPIFKFNQRFLAYFAMDLYNIYMTTELNGVNTYFLPFNQGSNGAGLPGGKGNPTNPNGYTTSYFWERVFTKDSMSDLIFKFITVTESKEEKYVNGQKKTKIINRLIFPRFHQYDVVNKIVDSVTNIGAGHNYLIEHSAGSGKSNSIAWIAYRLASAFDKNEKPIFDSVIVVTNRIVLDSQLQDTITSFDHTPGLVEAITQKKGSRGLKDAINDKKKIIICTVQKFLYAYTDFNEFEHRNFAIIIDEAHQGQSGESARTLKKSLINAKEELQKYADELGIDVSEIDENDEMIQEIIAQGHHNNQSFFAFTATPIQKTLAVFGEQCIDGGYRPFHTYSMKQAIEEGFILDVLKDYMTIRQAFMLANPTNDNPELLEGKTKQALIAYYKSHEHTINKKVDIIMANFLKNGRKKINGKGKAMIVADGRHNAVKYYFAVKDYIKNHPFECAGCGVLVAFSGEVVFDDDPNKKYIEAEMNIDSEGHYINSDKKFRAAFKSDEFNIMVVADKYQTGYDEPLLHSMFIDKRLRNVKAVQTLSRLNRICAGKTDTFILDFCNTPEEIKKAFQPFYKETTLIGEINFNRVYDLRIQLDKFGLFTTFEVDSYMKVLTEKKNGKKQDEKAIGKLSSILKPVIDNYIELDMDRRYQARDLMLKFIKTYAYITQIIRIDDQDLFKDYMFVSHLTHFLPKVKDPVIDITNMVRLEYSKLEETYHNSIILNDEEGTIKPSKPVPTLPRVKKVDTLDNIIDKVNEEFGGDLTPADKVVIGSIYDMMKQDQVVKKYLQEYAKTNDAQMFLKSIFPKEFRRILSECVKLNDDAYQRILSNASLQQSVMDKMAEGIYKELTNKKE